MGSYMQEIVRKRLVERIVGNSGDDTTGLQFSHKFVQESIYQSCLVSTRKTVHRSIAKHLELDKSDQLSNYYGVVAHHFAHAEEWRSACLYLQLLSETSEKLEMSKTVLETLDKWRKIKAKLGMKATDPAINTRFESAYVEEVVVLNALARSHIVFNHYKEARDLYLQVMKLLGRRFPVHTAGKVKVILKGIAFLQYKAATGGSFMVTEEGDASVATEQYHHALAGLGLLNFRRLNDLPGYLACIFMDVLSRDSTAKTILKACLGLVSIAPAIGLWSVYELSVREANRLAMEVEDEVYGSANLNLINGMAYSSRGELKQASGYFLKGGQDMFTLRDMELWAQCVSNACMCLFENGFVSNSLGLVRKAMKTALGLDNQLATLQMIQVAVDQLAWADDEDITEFMVTYRENESKWIAEKDNHTSWAFCRWRIGDMNADECVKEMARQQSICSFVNSHLFTGDRTGSTLGFLELYDTGVMQGKEALGGKSLAQIMGYIVQNVAFLESLSNHHLYSKCWALLLRACVLRRQGKLKAALVMCLDGQEAANKTNSRACLCMLWNEKGKCEEQLDGGDNVVCISSFNQSVDLGLDTGLMFIVRKATAKLEALGVERGDVLSRSRTGSRSQTTSSGSGKSKGSSDYSTDFSAFDLSNTSQAIGYGARSDRMSRGVGGLKEKTKGLSNAALSSSLGKKTGGDFEAAAKGGSMRIGRKGSLELDEDMGKKILASEGGGGGGGVRPRRSSLKKSSYGTGN